MYKDIELILPTSPCLSPSNLALAVTLISSPSKTALFQSMIPALYREGRLSWNPTVNKMTALVLKNLRGLDETLFQQCANVTLVEGGHVAGTVGLGLGLPEVPKKVVSSCM